MTEEVLNDSLSDDQKITDEVILRLKPLTFKTISDDDIMPKPKSTYKSPIKITDELREFTDRREKRAKELGISLYVLGADPDQNDEFQKLEDYIMENFIDLDLDVPEDIKAKYLAMKKEREKSQNK
ncbi:MAG: hypothetical protein IJ695_01250 [Butyrivibrio sp.]|nr:hypothetical protein [Butyrivibrio sp.]